jgi:hypothetical protein
MSFAPEHAAAAGAALGALITHSPALRELLISNCALGNDGMRPILDALPHSRSLVVFHCYGNGMSEAFARRRLVSAVRDCVLLRKVGANVSTPGQSCALRRVKALLKQRL